MARANRLGVLTWNTHMGRALTHDMWEWLVQTLPPIHVLFLQEVASYPKLRAILGPRWIVLPWWKVDGCTTAIAVKRKRFKVEQRLVRKIRFGSKHARHLVVMTVEDLRSRRLLLLGCLHPDPLGKGFVNANRLARWRHVMQVRAYVAYVRAWRRRHLGGQVILGGDVNEKIGDDRHLAVHQPDLHKVTAMHLFREVGLTAAHAQTRSGPPPHLDDVWTTKGLELLQRQQFIPPADVEGREHLDHDLVYAQYKVKP